MQASTLTEPTPTVAPTHRWWPPYARLTLMALGGWFAWQVAYVSFLGNVHVIIPGQAYRGGQPTASDIQNLVRRHGIRTIVNTRGCGFPEEWYVEEASACQRLGIQLEDITFSAMHMPSRQEVRELVQVLDRAERPLYIHCRHGSDRTGLASMILFLLDETYPYATARRQLGMRYGHAPLGRTTNLDCFFTLYEDWLAQTGQSHTPSVFRHWLAHEYRGGALDARFEKVERLFQEVRPGEALPYRVTVRNTSTGAWHFHPHRSAGIHVTLKLVDDAGVIHCETRAGLFERTVPVGETVQVVIMVPPIWIKGRYRLFIDLIEEGHCWFHQTGSEPWEEELVFRE